jgi:hypothetical protein
MQLQTPTLKAVLPQNRVDGFDIEIIQQDCCLIAGKQHELLFSSRYVEVNISCDGSNRDYPEPSSLKLLITQFATDDESVGIAVTPDFGLIILKHYQTLEGSGVFEITQGNHQTAVLILWIKDNQMKSTEIAVYTLAQKRIQTH